MSKKADGGDFGRCNLGMAFGFGGLPSENIYGIHKALSRSIQGLKSHHVPEGECTDIEKIQGDVF